MLDTDKKKVSISVKTSLKDKEQAANLFNELGLNLSTAINIFIKKSIAEGGLPFDIRDPFYSQANQTELNRRFKKLNDDQKDYVNYHKLIDNKH